MYDSVGFDPLPLAGGHYVTCLDIAMHEAKAISRRELARVLRLVFTRLGILILHHRLYLGWLNTIISIWMCM